MSWGYRIVIVFILFFTGLGVMVYTAMRQTNELVEENYYDKELKYQNVINGKNNFKRFNDSILVTTTDAAIVLKLPAEAVQHLDSGTVHFLKPSAKADDKIIVLRTNNEGIQQLPKNEITPGFYMVKASWTAAGVSYYDERKVVIK